MRRLGLSRLNEGSRLHADNSGVSAGGPWRLPFFPVPPFPPRSPVSKQESRLLEAWRAASRDARRAGRAWYGAARQAASELARRRRISFKRAVWLIAVLSNNKEWEVNLDLADDVATQWRHGEQLRGHYASLLRKAERILRGEFTALSGSKVEPFAAAIYGDDSAAVVDRHMFRAAGEFPRGGNARDAAVRRVSAALHNVARRVRRPVTEVQATIWVATRLNALGIPRTLG